MKTKLFTVILLITTLCSFGQNLRLLRDQKEKIKAFKVAFFTNELNLTADEAAKLWPLINAYETKQRSIKVANLKIFLNMRDDSGEDKILNDKEASQLLSQIENNDEELYEAKKKFNASLQSVLPPYKILKLRKAEEKFNKKLLEQFRDKRHND
jgi:hypothetical protein